MRNSLTYPPFREIKIVKKAGGSSMSELKVIEQLARKFLTTKTQDGKPDNYLFDRANRLTASIEKIWSLDELTAQNLGIDRFCLTCAVLFSDTHLVVTPQSSKAAQSTLADADKTIDFAAAAKTLAEFLAPHLAPQRIEKINNIIAESYISRTKMTEAKILSDARSLEDMGIIGILNDFRRQALAGKTVSDIAGAWQKKNDYGYFQTCLDDNFHFDSVRDLATQRLEAAQNFMNSLNAEISAEDLQQLIESPSQLV